MVSIGNMDGNYIKIKIITMSKLFNKAKQVFEDRRNDQNKAINISSVLQTALNISNDDVQYLVSNNLRINCGDYDIIPVRRFFEGWVTLLEIVQEGTYSRG